MARDIQLVPFIVYGYNEREGSITINVQIRLYLT